MTKNILITCIGSAPASAIARSLKNKYKIIGIDIKDVCIGNFVCDDFFSIKCTFDTCDYWEKIYDIIKTNDVKFVFVTLPFEAKEWSKRAEEFKIKYDCTVLLNNTNFCDLTNNKQKTYNFCIENDINIPRISSVDDRPIVIKEIEGCGSDNIQIVKSYKDNTLRFESDKFIIQKFIDGDEYTCDIISDPHGNVLCVVPKKRCFVKNGQAFISKTVYDQDIY